VKTVAKMDVMKVETKADLMAARSVARKVGTRVGKMAD